MKEKMLISAMIAIMMMVGSAAVFVMNNPGAGPLEGVEGPGQNDGTEASARLSLRSSLR